MSRVSAFKSFDRDILSPVVLPTVEKNNIPYYEDRKRAERENKKEDELCENTIGEKAWILANNAGNVLTKYPLRGFLGSKNSTAYESLTMSMFPYLTGGLTFIALFNGISKKFMTQHAAKSAGRYGLGMGLGVIFYGLAKEISKKLISIPVELKTGIELDRPYKKVVYKTPESKEVLSGKKSLDDDCYETGFEYHRVYESVDYPKIELLYKKGKDENRNKDFDIIAEKNGFGKNLTDSDQEVKPFIKEVLVKTKTAQNISQYLWSAVGVGLGVQKPWGNLLTNRLHYKTSGLPVFTTFKRNLSLFKDSAIDSCKEFFNGGRAGAINPKARIAGRLLIGLAVLSTIAGVINAVRNPYMKNTKDMENNNIFVNKSRVQED